MIKHCHINNGPEVLSRLSGFVLWLPLSVQRRALMLFYASRFCLNVCTKFSSVCQPCYKLDTCLGCTPPLPLSATAAGIAQTCGVDNINGYVKYIKNTQHHNLVMFIHCELG